VWQVLIQNWLRNRLYHELQAAASGVVADQAADGPPTGRCQAAFLFALRQEAGGLVDRCRGLATRHANGFTVHLGTLAGRGVAIVETGVGQESAAKAARAIIAAHQPLLVLATGFAGGLDERLRRGDLVIASEVALEAGELISFDLAREGLPGGGAGQVHLGRLLTVDRLIGEPLQKRRLQESSGAIAVDMETFGVAQVCRELRQPMLAVRIVSDAAGDQLPREVGRLLGQKSLAGKLGALAGAVMQRPSSVKDFYQLKEDALVASDRLAEHLDQLVRQFPAPADDSAAAAE
jgi:adenosylhomocysteine nucleosidase